MKSRASLSWGGTKSLFRALVNALLIFCVVLPTRGTDPLPDSHKLGGFTAGWTGYVGVSGGIPTRSTIYKTESAGASLATVQTDCDACPSGQVVKLSAGFYAWSGTLTIGTSNMTLRGAGAGFLGKSASSVAVGTGTKTFTVQNRSYWTAGDPVRVFSSAGASNYVDGTVTSYSGNSGLGGGTLVVNATTSGGSGTKTDWIIANTGWTVITSTATGGAILVGTTNWYNQFATPVSGAHVTWSTGFTQGATSITVTSAAGMTTGNLIFLDQLNDADTQVYSQAEGQYLGSEYTSVANPAVGNDRAQFQVNKIAGISGTTITLSEPLYMPNWASANTTQVWYETDPGLPVTASGIETLCCSNPVDQGLWLQYTYGCWISGCSVTGPGAHNGYISFLMSVRPEIRKNYLVGPGSTDDYGIRPYMSSGALVVDNIGDACGTLMMRNGCAGSVWAYNFEVNAQVQNGFQTAALYTHGGFPNMCLSEGNYAVQDAYDYIWPSGAYLVGFRNRNTGVADGSYSVTGNIQAVEVAYYFRHTAILGGVLGTTGVLTVYEDTPLTANHDGSRVYSIGSWQGGNINGTSYDATTYSTLIREVNWDSAHGAIYSPGGYTTADLPNSYWLSSKPTWFGNLSWPCFDPNDPTRTYVGIPSGYRWFNGSDPPTGTAGTAFSGSTKITGSSNFK